MKISICLSPKIGHISKGLVNPRFKLFSYFAFMQIRVKMRFGDLRDGKRAFFDDQNIHLLKSKNWSFFKAVDP